MSNHNLLVIAVLLLLIIPVATALSINIDHPSQSSTLSPLLEQTDINITTNTSANCTYTHNQITTAFAQISSTSHSATFALSPGEDYEITYNCTQGNSNASAQHTFATDEETVDMTITVQEGNRSANITLATSRVVNSTLYYGTTQQNDYTMYPSSIANTSMQTTTAYQLTGLADQTIYYYTFIAQDNYTLSHNTTGTFQTSDTTPPTMTLTNTTTDRTIALSWTTSEETTCTVHNGTSSSYGSWQTQEGISYSVSYHNMTPETMYYFLLNCTDTQYHTQHAFTLETQNDTTAPVITLLSPTNAVDDNDVTIRLKTNEPATCSYATRDINYTSMTTITSSATFTHNFTKTRLDNGNYEYFIKCKDQYDHIGEEEIQITIDEEIINQTYYGSTLVQGQDTLARPSQSTTASDVYHHFFRLEEEKEIDIKQEEWSLQTITLLPDMPRQVTLKVDLLKAYDYTDLNAIILQAYDIESIVPYTVTFTVSQNWLQMKNAPESLVRLFVFDTGWKPAALTRTKEGFISGKVQGSRIAIGILPEEIMNHLEEQKEVQTQQAEQKESTSVNTQQRRGTQGPVEEEIILASPFAQQTQLTTTLIATIILVLTSGIAAFMGYEIFVKKKGDGQQKSKNNQKRKEESISMTSKEEILALLGEGMNKKHVQDKEPTTVKTNQAHTEDENQRMINQLLQETQKQHPEHPEHRPKQEQNSKERKESDIIEQLKETSLTIQRIGAQTEEIKESKPRPQLQHISEEKLTAFVHNAQKEGYSNKAIESALRKKGYDDQMISRLMGNPATKQMKPPYAKKLDKIYSSLQQETIRRLSQQGHSAEEIQSILDKINK